MANWHHIRYSLGRGYLRRGCQCSFLKSNGRMYPTQNPSPRPLEKTDHERTLGTMMQPENPTVKDPAQVAANNRLAQTQQQVNEVVDIMKTNVERIMEREDRLTELDRRADNLTMSAAEFQTTSRKLKKKYWWKNTKMTIILVCVVLVIIVVIIVACVGIPSSSSSGGGGGGGTPVTTLAPSSPTMPV
ncbi:vesicle-associated membrane protein 3-like [Penaeus japonicus]|uniref:vesicle-associated membrane protein 3-like n=1 Tax=Penaeus japonicus TaxID=27405 RepID=UPI001C70F54A|nr:vesicle-associated membrane protein 3-like [Penaeus japonicus]